MERSQRFISEASAPAAILVNTMRHIPRWGRRSAAGRPEPSLSGGHIHSTPNLLKAMSEASEKSKIIVKPLRRGWHRFSLDIAQEREIARKHGQLAETLYEAAVHPYVQRLLLCLLVVDIIAAVVEMILRAYVWFDTCSLHQTDVRTATTTTCIITLIVAALFLVELLSLAFSLRHHFFRSWHRWMDALLVAMMLTFTILTLRSVADDASIARYVVVMMRVVRIFHATAMTVNQISEKNTIEKGAVVEKARTEAVSHVLYQEDMLDALNQEQTGRRWHHAVDLVSATVCMRKAGTITGGSTRASKDTLNAQGGLSEQSIKAAAAGAAGSSIRAAVAAAASGGSSMVTFDAGNASGAVTITTSPSKPTTGSGGGRAEASMPMRLMRKVVGACRQVTAMAPSAAGSSTIASPENSGSSLSAGGGAANAGAPMALRRSSQSMGKAGESDVIAWEESAPRPLVPIPSPIVPAAAAASGDGADGTAAEKKPGDPIRRLLTADAEIDHSSSGQDARNARLKKSATSIRDPSYTLKQFHDDMVFAFPELKLYMGEGKQKSAAAGAAAAGGAAMMSGRTSEEEYLRTIGALFAVYWLMRLDLPLEDAASSGYDGQRGFCFGVDSEWSPPSQECVKAIPPVVDGAPTPAQLRKQFLERTDWGVLHRLLIDAGMLDSNGAVMVERTVSMLALTAIHDIMKVASILPTVTKGGNYHGCLSGTTIQDHDVALGYVLETDGSSLPAFDQLAPSQRAAVQFTQADLGFNHGWLVQAEAPPGALFSSMKALLDTGGLQSSDIAFYFVHWITDLAGAVYAHMHQQQHIRTPSPAPFTHTPSLPCSSTRCHPPPKAWRSSY